MTDSEARCVPLCGATRAYGRFNKPWLHEPQCPVRQKWEQERASHEPLPGERYRRLSINPEPIRLVDAGARDVWTRSWYQPRCWYEDGRGQCSSRKTKWHKIEGVHERRCEKHAPKEEA